MINLLPPEGKNILQKEETQRLVFILETFILFFLIILSLVLFSVKTYIAGQTEGYRILVNFEQQKSKTIEAQNLEKEIGLINQNLSKLESFYEGQSQTAKLLKKISYVMPEEIYLTFLALNSNQEKNGRFQVSLTGYSENRDALLDFKKKLESESSFQGVYFPPSNWVKPEGINWSCSFIIL